MPIHNKTGNKDVNDNKALDETTIFVRYADILAHLSVVGIID